MKHTLTAVISLLLLLCTSIPSPAAGPDAETRALIAKLGLKEAAQPVREWPRWRKPDKVYIAMPPADPARQKKLLDSIREVAGGVKLVPIPLRFGQPVPEKIVRDAEVMLGFCSAELLKNAHRLRWFQHYGSGVNHCMYPGIEKKDFILTNNQHSSAPPIAEHVIAMMMMLTRGLTEFHSNQARGLWQRRDSIHFPMIEVSGKTMLVAGLGGIGTEVARRASALGMHVVATRHSSHEGPDFVDYVGLPPELYDLAKKADVVVNALPLTDETRGLFDKKFFDSLKPGTYFISVGRGRSTVTADLVRALREGRLAGAGLDVTDPEPLPPDHVLWTLPNVIITPHVAGITDRGFERGWLIIRENLRRYLNGEKLLNVVNVERGY
jgi:D-2-hydroxyacid dehydrogenase (NADP+)